jgi:hypothetical protein
LAAVGDRCRMRRGGALILPACADSAEVLLAII